MSNALVIQKGRTNTFDVDMGMDVSADTLSSQVRAEPNVESALIMDFVVTKPNGGADGLVRLSVDNTITAQIAAFSGYMDIKRIVGTEPVPVFEKPLEVVFQGTVTE